MNDPIPEDIAVSADDESRPKTGPDAYPFDQSDFRAWLSGLTYDSGRRGLSAPSQDCAQEKALQTILTKISPACARSSDVVDALLEMLRQLISISNDARHPFQSEVQKLIDYYEMASRDYVKGGLAALASGSFDLLPPNEAIIFVRNCLFELFEHMRGILGHAGFFDTVPGGLKKVVVVNGRYRTGSVLAVNAVVNTLKAAGESTRIVYGDFDQIDRFIECFSLGAFEGHWLILKSHNWLPRAERSNVITLYTQRNLADVAASAMRFWQRNGTPEEVADENYVAFNEAHIINELFYQKLLNEYVVDMKSTVKIDYDRFYNDKEEYIRYLAEHLDVRLGPSEIRAASAMLEPLRAKQVADSIDGEFDERTLLQRRHVSETLGAKYAGLHVLSPRMIDALRKLGAWPFER